jgi:hypothetical protein
MPVSIKQSVSVRLSDLPEVVPGQESVVLSADALEAAGQVITVTCDNPECKRGIAGSVKVIQWDQQAAATNHDEVPNDAYRIITVELFNRQRMAFCGVACSIDGLRALPPLKSPSETVVQFPEKKSL